MKDTSNEVANSASTSLPSGAVKIKLALSDCSVVNNLLRVIQILDEEKLRLAQDVEELCDQLEMTDGISRTDSTQGENAKLPPRLERGTLHERVECLTQLLSQCISYRDQLLDTDRQLTKKLSFSDKFKIIELVQAGHELKYQRVMREILFAKE